MAQQSARLGRLVDDMLVLARADAAGYPMSTTDVDLGGIARASVRDLTLQANERQIAHDQRRPRRGIRAWRRSAPVDGRL